MTTETTETTETTTNETTANENVTEAQPESTEAKAEPKAKKEPKPKKEKPVREKPAHLAKVEKVAAQLPLLTEEPSAVLVAAKNLTTADICGVIAHLQVEVRRRSITAVADAGARGDEKLNEGDRVKILTCQHNPSYIGRTGTVTKVQRVRCYVRLDGKEYSEKDDGRTGDYFYHSDCKSLGVAKHTEPEVQPAEDTFDSLPEPTEVSTLEDAPAPVEATGT